MISVRRLKGLTRLRLTESSQPVMLDLLTMLTQFKQGTLPIYEPWACSPLLKVYVPISGFPQQLFDRGFAA